MSLWFLCSHKHTTFPITLPERARKYAGTQASRTPHTYMTCLDCGKESLIVVTLKEHERVRLTIHGAGNPVAETAGLIACNDPELIERIALEMAHVAFKEAVELPIRWTDVYGRSHDKVVGRPLAMYAMRGISAHSNGFQSCRALHLIQMLLGALEGPGNFRARAPFPKPVPPPQLPENDPIVIEKPNTQLARPPLGFPARPEDLAIDAEGKPLRIDHAYSWESPIAAHGAMHMVITNAVNANPYAIDTLILFMANMAWNSTMNTKSIQEKLVELDPEEFDQYKIPFLVMVDAFHSETVNFADLVLPDTRVSRNHAEVVQEKGAHFLVDLGSKHGTFINGERVEGRHQLSDERKNSLSCSESSRRAAKVSPMRSMISRCTRLCTGSQTKMLPAISAPSPSSRLFHSPSRKTRRTRASTGYSGRSSRLCDTMPGPTLAGLTTSPLQRSSCVSRALGT